MTELGAIIDHHFQRMGCRFCASRVTPMTVLNEEFPQLGIPKRVCETMGQEA